MEHFLCVKKLYIASYQLTQNRVRKFTKYPFLLFHLTFKKVVFYSAVFAENIQGVFLPTVPSYVQYQNEKACSVNKELFYIKNFLKK